VTNVHPPLKELIKETLAQGPSEAARVGLNEGTVVVPGLPLPAQVDRELHDVCGQPVECRPRQPDQFTLMKRADHQVRVTQDSRRDLLAEADFTDVISLVEVEELIRRQLRVHLNAVWKWSTHGGG
jgi:hypothetical protein